MTDLAALKAPFPPACVSWRVGSTTADKSKGMALAFINSRDVQDRLDEVCGPENWQDRYEFHGPRTICYLSLRIDGEWVTKADGAGDSDVESEKGAISDALKRAAVKWGVGRYLYHLPSPWVEIEQRGRSSVIKASEQAKLERLLANDAKASASTPPPPPADPVTTLAGRADTFVGVLNATTTAANLEKAWALGSKLCADLDLKDPDKLAAITALYEARQAELDATPFRKEAA